MVLATNLTGTFMFCQEAARQMIKQNATNGKKGGRIIITASVGGFIGGKGVVGYGASKAGCLSLARTMANNFGRENITVNCICPGYVVTPLNEEFFIDKDGNKTKYYEQQSKATSVRRLGTIEEIAGPVLAMCSDSFNYMTGTYLLCDGGQVHSGRNKKPEYHLKERFPMEFENIIFTVENGIATIKLNRPKRSTP